MSIFVTHSLKNSGSNIDTLLWHTKTTRLHLLRWVLYNGNLGQPRDFRSELCKGSMLLSMDGIVFWRMWLN